MGDTTPGAVARRRATDTALGWIGHPGTLLAALGLLLNDHLLKQALPGAVTGKLSDVAGLLVAPPLLALVLTLLSGRASDRLAVGSLLAVGLGFTLVKATAVGAGLASEVWTVVVTPSQMRADRTDLIALPALALAGWLRTRARDRPRTTLAARRARVLFAVPLAVLATAATSAVGARSVHSVDVWQGRTVAWEGYGNLVGIVWTTADGGVTWTRDAADTPSGSHRPTGRTEGCVPGAADHCYRVVPGEPRVEQTTDGGRSWSTAWQISPGRQVYWNRATSHTGLLAVVGDHVTTAPAGIAASSLVVTAVPGGYTVIVAATEDGLVVRDVSGRWQRHGFTDFGGPAPVPLTGSPGGAAGEVVLAVVAGVVAGFAGIAFDRLRRIDPRLRGGALGRVLGRPLMAFGWLALLTRWCAASDTSTRTAVEMAFLSVCALPTLALVWPAPRLDARLAARSDLAAVGSAAGSVLTGLLVLIPFLGWVEGAPDSYARACLLALAALLAGVAGCSLLGWRGAARPIPAAPRRDGGGGRHL